MNTQKKIRKPLTEEHKRKISEHHKKTGVGKWMIGRKIPKEIVEKRAAKLRGKKRPPFSDEWKKNIGEGGKGRKWTPEHREKMLLIRRATNSSPEYRAMMSRIKKGVKHTEGSKRKLSISKIGPLNPNWKDNATWRSGKIRQTREYREWRIAVLARDNNKCVWCGSTEKLQADHIKPFMRYPESRFDLSNGRTLCHPCHKTTDTYGFNKKTHQYDTI